MPIITTNHATTYTNLMHPFHIFMSIPVFMEAADGAE